MKIYCTAVVNCVLIVKNFSLRYRPKQKKIFLRKNFYGKMKVDISIIFYIVILERIKIYKKQKIKNFLLTLEPNPGRRASLDYFWDQDIDPNK